VKRKEARERGRETVDVSYVSFCSRTTQYAVSWVGSGCS